MRIGGGLNGRVVRLDETCRRGNLVVAEGCGSGEGGAGGNSPNRIVERQDRIDESRVINPIELVATCRVGQIRLGWKPHSVRLPRRVRVFEIHVSDDAGEKEVRRVGILNHERQVEFAGA